MVEIFIFLFFSFTAPETCFKQKLYFSPFAHPPTPHQAGHLVKKSLQNKFQIGHQQHHNYVVIYGTTVWDRSYSNHCESNVKQVYIGKANIYRSKNNNETQIAVIEVKEEIFFSHCT